jgi:hypothetical protein
MPTAKDQCRCAISTAESRIIAIKRMLYSSLLCHNIFLAKRLGVR